MSPMMTIAKREFRAYFDSPLAYVVICLSFLLLGLAFFELRGGFWQVDQASLQRMFEYLPLVVGILVVPVVTMRLLAEEKRSGTLELLITLPVRDSDVILGKYMGALGLVWILLISTLIYPVAMFMWPWQLGPLDWGPVLAGYLGMLLFTASSVSLGLLVSSLTNSQAVAFFITFFVSLLLWFLTDMVQLLPSTAGSVLGYLSTQSHIDAFTRGLVDLRDVVYFLSVTTLALVVSFRALERRKWA